MNAQKMFSDSKIIQLLLPAQFVAIDIETGNAPQAAVIQAIENWKAPSNWKAETIEAKRVEMATKKSDKAALLDASPILCIACRTESGGILFNAMDSELHVIDGWIVYSLGSEAEMLKAFRSWADRVVTPDTLIVGHNIIGFDLPKIRNATIRNRLKPPLFTVPKMRGELSCEVVDTMKLGKAFSMEHRDDFMMNLDKLAMALSIERPKQLMSGADVPLFHEAGRFFEILIYCCIDTETTARAFQLMSGTANDLI